ncbi:MAG TPA: glycosyltransferase [Candidatus Binatia bacterium]|jgi:glycosyltransferase involved in cell wall biosynthesis|nr:glycosyltransferase [Candidatus Binatia bacterium]
MSDLTVSVIITTYDRARHLERVLPAFHHLRFDAFEVIVVNGPSSDDTAAVLGAWAGRIKVVDCPVAHMTTARNLGLRQAAGDVVVFIDDDARPATREWLDVIVGVFADDAEGRVGAVGGPAWHCDTDLLQFGGGMSSDYGLQVFVGADGAGPQPDGHRWVRRTIGCNSAYRRTALLAIGGFDEHITYYGDDADVALRLARAGYETVHAPAAGVRHYPATSKHLGPPFIRNRRVITQDDTYYCLKNGDDPLPRRLLQTLRLAPRKHYVGDMFRLASDGQISRAALWRFLLWQWPRGLGRGLRLGLLHERANRTTATSPPPLLRFPKSRPSTRLRVCLVTDRIPPCDLIGGVERYTWDLARGLHELGHDVHLIAQIGDRVRRESLDFTIHGIRPVDLDDRVGFTWHPILTTNARYAVAVARRIAALQAEGLAFDVVHASNWNAPGVAVLRAGLAPLVLMLVTPLSQIMQVQHWEPNDDLRRSLELDRWQIEHADAVCVPSWGVLSTYRDTMGLDLEPQRATIHRTPLGIAPTGEPSALRTGPPHRLLFVGRLEPRKGIQVLLDALPGLLTAHPDWHCDLVGDANPLVPGTDVTYRAQFTAMHAGTPWLDRVHFHHAVSDARLARFYADCDVFVAPSLFESFGLIYPEAMQYGKPVVGCRTGGIPESVRDEIDGILVEPGSVDSLAAGLDRLMSDAALRARIGAAGLARVRDDLNHRAMAARLTAVYERVAADRGAGRHRAPTAAWGDADGAHLIGILDALAAHVAAAAPVAAGAEVASRTQRLREMLEHFRREPIGGRLLSLKRVVYWFTASAFDRQAKVQENMLAVLVEMEQELAQLHARRDTAAESADAPTASRPGR